MKKRKSKRKKEIKTKEEADFEEIVFTCPGCGKTIKMIKLRGLKTEGLLCQSCAQGEIKLDTD